MEIKRINLISVIKVCLVIGITLGVLIDIYHATCHYIFSADTSNIIAKIFTEAAESVEGLEVEKLTVETQLKYEGIFGEWQASLNEFLIMSPIITVIITLIYGIVLAVVYNIAAKVIGGIRFETSS